MRQRRDPDIFELSEPVQAALPLGPAAAAAVPAARPALRAGAGTVGGEALPRSWQTFLHALADALRALEDGHWLTLEARAGRHFVCMSAHGAAGLVAESDKGREAERSPGQRAVDADRLTRLGWERLPLDRNARNGTARVGAWLREWPAPAPLAAVALLAVRTLREVWGVANPRDLVYAATDARRHDILLPSLRLNRRPRRPEAADTGHLLRPASQRQLLDAVLATLREHTGVADLEAGANGAIRLRRRAVGVSLYVAEGGPAVDMFATVATDATASPELLAALNDEAARTRAAKFVVNRNCVIAMASVPCQVFVPELLTGALDELLDAADSLQRRLREELSGALFVDDEFAWGDTDGYRVN